MARWGGKVLDWLELRGDERVLDAGLRQRPGHRAAAGAAAGGRVVALDASPAMVDQARGGWPASATASNIVVSDLGGGHPDQRLVDAILSTATLHWIADHDAVFRNFARVLRRGGSSRRRPVRRERGERARGAGGEPARTTARATTLPTRRTRSRGSRRPGSATSRSGSTTSRRRSRGAASCEDYLRHDLPRPLSARPADELPGIAAAAAQRMAGRTLDYVRLNIRARRREP